MSREKAHTSIFEGDYELSQFIEVDPSKVRPIWSRVLIRDAHDDEKIGSLFIPAGDKGKDTKRIGIVVAVGLGDKFTEHGLDNYGQVVRRPVGKCENCSGEGHVVNRRTEPHPYTGPRDYDDRPCVECGGKWRDDGTFEAGDGLARIPMEVKPGDKVLYDRRREAEIYIQNVRYSLVYEEQSILGIIEE